jgi:hypothetical protein
LTAVLTLLDVHQSAPPDDGASLSQGGPMNIRTLTPKLTASGIVIAMAAAPAALAAASTANWQIPLKATASYPKANGSAQYQSQPGQREIQIEVQHIPSMAGKTVVCTVAGTTLGHTKVSRLGQADIIHNTELRQKVPPISHGSTVTVRTASGVLIAYGRF